MNYGMIFYILGMASGFEALFLLLPILVSLTPQNNAQIPQEIR